MNDWNYTGTAFLGYPNRQYLIAALPAVFLGRSITALHLGFAYPFLIGLVMLFAEIKNWLKDWGINENLSLIPVYALPAFRFIPEYFMNFEQAITPVALTMMGNALFLKLYRKPTFVGFIGLSWVGCLFCDSYTPAVASLGLLLCFLLLYMISLMAKGSWTFILPPGQNGSPTIENHPEKVEKRHNAKAVEKAEKQYHAKAVEKAGKQHHAKTVEKAGKQHHAKTVEKARKQHHAKAVGDAKNFPMLLIVTGGLFLNIACFFLATILSSRSDRLESARQDVSLVSLALES